VHVLSGVQLAVPAGSLVVIAGLPGAGKTSLLRRLAATAPADVVALDSEDVATRLRRLPVGYRLLRPLVHAVHLLTVLAAVSGPVSCVLTTDPLTGPGRRLLLGTAARLTGRRLHVIVVDASVAEALDGQWSRGRRLGSRRMARHVRRSPALRRRPPFATSAVTLSRAGAGTTAGLRLTTCPRRAPHRPAHLVQRVSVN
jgi:ABC-type cobalamin/Fe3+-siderophores transport system ATPase subunit